MSEHASLKILLADDGSQLSEAAVTLVAMEEALVQAISTIGEGGRDEKADVVLLAETRGTAGRNCAETSSARRTAPQRQPTRATGIES
jgi:hypothetical protein